MVKWKLEYYTMYIERFRCIHFNGSYKDNPMKINARRENVCFFFLFFKELVEEFCFFRDSFQLILLHVFPKLRIW